MSKENQSNGVLNSQKKTYASFKIHNRLDDQIKLALDHTNFNDKASFVSHALTENRMELTTTNAFFNSVSSFEKNIKELKNVFYKSVENVNSINKKLANKDCISFVVPEEKSSFDTYYFKDGIINSFNDTYSIKDLKKEGEIDKLKYTNNETLVKIFTVLDNLETLVFDANFTTEEVIEKADNPVYIELKNLKSFFDKNGYSLKKDTAYCSVSREVKPLVDSKSIEIQKDRTSVMYTAALNGFTFAPLGENSFDENLLLTKEGEEHYPEEVRNDSVLFLNFYNNLIGCLKEGTHKIDENFNLIKLPKVSKTETLLTHLLDIEYYKRVSKLNTKDTENVFKITNEFCQNMKKESKRIKREEEEKKEKQPPKNEIELKKELENINVIIKKYVLFLISLVE